MFQKVFTNGVAISYGPSLPSTAVADGTIFYKTVSSAGFPAGFYLYGTRPDANPTKFGPQVGQQWFSVDAGDLYLRISGGTLTGPLGLTNYLNLSGASAAQRILFGNVSAVQPIVLNSQNKILSIGLGTSFDQNGGAMTTTLRADFTNLTNGLTWNGQKVWHAGNDGTGSGLDADLLEGFHASSNSSGNTIPVRDSSGDIKSRRYYFLADDSAAVYGQNPVVDFVTTRGDGLSIRSKTSIVRESIRVDADQDGASRKFWNINIIGNAATASSVSWTNIANKPAWLNDGTVGWDDISGKPDPIYVVNFDAAGQSKSKSPLEITSNGTKDVFSGIWVGENVLDMPKNSNSYPDPNGALPITLINSNFYWAGFQVLKSANNASGVQLIANWNAEDVDSNNDGQGFEDNRSLLMYRVNDDNSALKNNTTDLNLFSPWIKIWTNLTLTKLSQLENDANFISTSSLDDFLKLNSPTTQTSVSDISFNGSIFFRTIDNSKGLSFDKLTANVTLDGGAHFTTTSGHFQTTSGNIYSNTGKIHSTSGELMTGGTGGLGSVFLKPGNVNYTGQIIFGNTASSATWHSRIFVDVNAKAMCYVIGDGSIDMGTTSHHWFNKTIKSTGDVVAYASDRRLKGNIQPILNAVSKVKNLGGYVYDWDLDKCSAANFSPSNPTEHGLIAQEVLAIVPDAVAESAIGNGFLTVKYERIVPLLTAAISEQDVIINEQTMKIESLEARLAHLEKMIEKLV